MENVSDAYPDLKNKKSFIIDSQNNQKEFETMADIPDVKEAILKVLGGSNNNKDNNGDKEKKSAGYFSSKIEESQENRRLVKEKYQNTKMRILKNKIESSELISSIFSFNWLDEPLETSQKYELTHFLKKQFQPEDLTEYISMKRKYTFITNTMSVLSLANVVAVGVLWRRFLSFNTLQKIMVGSTVFLATHSAGTYARKKESEAMNDKLIDKYSYLLKDMQFDDKEPPSTLHL